jgi:hypothetical protein
MKLSNSERQRRYRNRRLGLGGKYERLGCLAPISTKRSVKRLAFHFDCSITELLERLINEKAAAVLDRLDEDAQYRFLAQELVTDDA